MRPLLLLVAVLLVPILPFLLWSSALEEWTAAWVAAPPRRGIAALGIVTLLASDLVLPVPASVVSTYSGSLFGWGGGTLINFLGTSAGAMAGFAAARAAGPWVVRRVERSRDYEYLRRLCDRTGAYLVVLLRAVPVLAEASVLMVGLHGMRWSHFLPALLLSNLGLATGYALLGAMALHQQWLPAALAISALAPLALTALIRSRPSRAAAE